MNDSISTVRTFHVAMLTDKEESEMSFEFFKNETSLSKDKQNYGLSLCARSTFFLSYLNRYQELILFNLNDDYEKNAGSLVQCMPKDQVFGWNEAEIQVKAFDVLVAIMKFERMLRWTGFPLLFICLTGV